MLLVNKKATLKWNPANKKRYVGFGYEFTGSGKEFSVDIEHLTPTTRANVYYACDYCGKVCETDFKKYNLNLKRSITKKDCCEDCVKEKTKESSMSKYGVDSPNKASSVKEKKKENTIKKYGVVNISQLEETKKKVKNTVQVKYGVSNVFQSDEVISKMKITKYNNKSITTSRPQLYLNTLLNGNLNYPVGNCSIDIALTERKIAVEYDGGGHDLHVKFKEMSEEEFKQKELNREFFLINKGWKIIRIISKKDQLPSDDEILYLIQFAIQYLNKNHTWIRIDIDNGRIYGSKIKKNISFKNLRKITQEILDDHQERISDWYIDAKEAEKYSMYDELI